MALVTKTGLIGAPLNGEFLGKPGSGGAENEIPSGTDNMEATYTVASDCAINFEFKQPSGGTTEVHKYPGGDSSKSELLYTNNSNTSGDVLNGTRVAEGDQLFVTHDATSGLKWHRITTEA